MKYYSLFYCFVAVFFFTNCSKQEISVTSPNGKTEVKVWLNSEGQALWQLSLISDNKSEIVLNPSTLGLNYDNHAFRSGLTIKNISKVTKVTDKYTLFSGKTSYVDATANSFTVTLNNQNKELMVHFRVYDDGAAFQYEIPGTGIVTVNEEYSTFAVANHSAGKAWLLPHDKVTPWSPAYENSFQNAIAIGTKSPDNTVGWCFPLLFNVNNNWMLISEAGNESFIYGGTHIAPDCEGGIYSIKFAQPEEAEGLHSSIPTLELPGKTNWRTVVVGDNLNTILTTNMVQTVNQPSIYTEAETKWIQSGVTSWSWWSDDASPRDYNKMLPFIDMASELNWPYFLVDANWDLMKNGDVKQLADYAKTNNVGLFIWYNSGGPHNVSTERPRDIMHDPERRKKEMAWLQEVGIKGIKVDFFQSDKPAVMQLYKDILIDAMDHRILVNFHGCTLPRGWERTYPNLMTMEAVQGAECYRYNVNYPERAPYHNTILVFTRNVVGSMDYTPTTFTNSKNAHITTFAHELALSVLFESGLTHIADAVRGIMSTPDYVQDFFRKLPSSWDETKYLYGEPGKDAVVARRKGDDWFIAGINGENITKNITFDCSLLPKDAVLELITDDGAKKFKHHKFTPGSSIELDFIPYGGFVLTTRQ